MEYKPKYYVIIFEVLLWKLPEIAKCVTVDVIKVGNYQQNSFYLQSTHFYILDHMESRGFPCMLFLHELGFITALWP